MPQEHTNKHTLLIVIVSIFTSTITTVLIIAVVAGIVIKTTGLDEVMISTSNNVYSDSDVDGHDGYNEDFYTQEEDPGNVKEIIDYLNTEIKLLYESNPGDWEVGPDGKPVVPAHVQMDIDALTAERDAFMKANGL